MVSQVIESALSSGAYALTQQAISEARSEVTLGHMAALLADSVNLIAIGKASLAMTEAAHQMLGERIKSALVIYPKGYRCEVALPEHFVCLPSSHPVPAQNSVDAAKALIDAIKFAVPGNFLFLISGGTSSLVELPVNPLTLKDVRRVTQELLSRPVTIEQINAIRCALSQVKGGRLRQWINGREVLQLSLSDVPNDDPAIIGSGLLFPAQQQPPETLLAELIPNVGSFAKPLYKCENTRVIHQLIGNSEKLATLILEKLTNERSDPGSVLEINDTLEHGINVIQRWLKDSKESVLVMHGEVTMTLPQRRGQGGRCSHFALCVAQILEKDKINGTFIALATDGADGNSPAAGGWVDGNTWKQMESLSIDPQLQLESYNSYTALCVIGQSIEFPKGHTNVRDIYVMIKHPSE